MSDKEIKVIKYCWGIASRCLAVSGLKYILISFAATATQIRCLVSRNQPRQGCGKYPELWPKLENCRLIRHSAELLVSVFSPNPAKWDKFFYTSRLQIGHQAFMGGRWQGGSLVPFSNWFLTSIIALRMKLTKMVACLSYACAKASAHLNSQLANIGAPLEAYTTIAPYPTLPLPTRKH